MKPTKWIQVRQSIWETRKWAIERGYTVKVPQGKPWLLVFNKRTGEWIRVF